MGQAFAALSVWQVMGYGLAFFGGIYLLLGAATWLLTQRVLPALGVGRPLDPRPLGPGQLRREFLQSGLSVLIFGLGMVFPWGLVQLGWARLDDNAGPWRIAAEILRGLGFQVGEAEHGRAAVEFCRRAVPAFVLLDWNMPEMDGITCLRALRAMNLAPRPAVVMCTTENGLTKIREALESGADEYIMKPYDRDVLLAKLEQLGLMEPA